MKMCKAERAAALLAKSGAVLRTPLFAGLRGLGVPLLLALFARAERFLARVLAIETWPPAATAPPIRFYFSAY